MFSSLGVRLDTSTLVSRARSSSAAVRLAAAATQAAAKLKQDREEAEVEEWHAHHFYSKSQELFSRVERELELAKKASMENNMPLAWDHQGKAAECMRKARQARSMLALGPPPHDQRSMS